MAALGWSEPRQGVLEMWLRAGPTGSCGMSTGPQGAHRQKAGGHQLFRGMRALGFRGNTVQCACPEMAWTCQLSLSLRCAPAVRFICSQMFQIDGRTNMGSFRRFGRGPCCYGGLFGGPCHGRIGISWRACWCRICMRAGDILLSCFNAT